MKTIVVGVLLCLVASLPVSAQMTRQQLQQAIDNAAGTGACVIIPAATTIEIESPVIVNYSNACVQGSGPTSVLMLKGPTASAAMIISGPGPVGAQRTLSSPASEGSTGLVLNDALDSQLGDYVDISDVVTPPGPTTQPARQVSRLFGPAGNIIYVIDPMYEFFPTGTTVTKVSMLKNVRVGNLRIVRHPDPLPVNPSGIYAAYVVDSDFFDISGEAIPGAVFAMSVGHNNRIRNISAYRSGTAGLSDISLYIQTGLHASQLDSRMAAGFGPGFVSCNGSTVSDVISTGAGGRGLKLAGSSFNNFSNIQVHSTSTTATGLSITNGSRRNHFTNIQALSNGQAGIWINNAPNNSNLFTNLRARFSYGNGHDIQIFDPSANNVFSNVEYGTLFNSGTETIFK
jgi:hypothetical protein